MKIPKLFSRQAQTPNNNWRDQITRPASVLEVGGFRPTNDPFASSFGEVRVGFSGSTWPMRNGKPLLPICQMNLNDAPFVPDSLEDVVLLQVFIASDWWSSDLVVMDNVQDENTPFCIMTFDSLEGLQPIEVPDHGSTILPFEARWEPVHQLDYPTHDTMPIDFDALGIGSFYEQDGIDKIHRTKVGGWPSCIQSEPWWDYQPDGKDFEFVLQVDTEEKAKCFWGDSGSVFVARDKNMKSRWAIEGQCY